MTNSTRARTCRTCNKNLNTRNRVSDNVGVLPGTFNDMCLHCYEDDSEPEPVSTGRANMSHTSCHHDKTPAARARCRRLNASKSDAVADNSAPIVPTIVTGKTTHIVLVMGDCVAPLCNPKSVTFAKPIEMSITCVNCENCLHKYA